MTQKPALSIWRRLGRVEGAALVPARLELHQAAQLVSVAGRSYLPARADDSHSSFTWLNGLDGMAGEPIDGASTFRIGLHPSDASLVITDAAGSVSSRFALRGRSLDQAVLWIRGELATRGADPKHYSLAKPYELAAHSLLSGGTFAAEPVEAYEELALAWANADLLFKQIAAREKGSSDVRLWPHHFDVGLLIGAIGVGLSPGDEGSLEPYFYVNPYPTPASLPALAAGRWHTQGWTGAVLTHSDITTCASAAEQKELSRAFLDGAIASCRSALQ